MADIDDYLQEGFNPRSVTMPRLRSILVTHNIDYPSAAKKAQLVQLVEDHVLPQAPKLRAQKARAKRSSMGIVNAGSAEDTGIWDDHDLAPPSSARRSKSPRKLSARIKSEEPDDTAVFRSPAKRTSRSVSRTLPHADEVPDYGAVKSARRTSRRTVTPQIKDESEDEEFPPPEDENVFTDDNPFQSGSSPPNTKTPSRRRTGEIETARSAKSSRRKTDGPSQLLIPKTRRHQTPAEELEPGEEFTPGEQLELEEAASKGEVSVPPRKSARKSSRRPNLTSPLLVLFFTLLSVYSAWYRQEKVAIGYCGLGRPAQQIIPPDVPIPEFVVPFVEPQCELCPAHAYCYENFEARCEPDFVLRAHPLSFGGLVPLPPTCEPDGEKARRVQAVADKAVEELRERRAKYECGELVNDEGNLQDTPSIDEQELKETVSRKRSKKLNSAEFEDLWTAAIGEVTAREEVDAKPIETPDSPDFPNRKLSSTSLARIPLSCAVRRSIRLGLARHRFTIGLLILVVVGIFVARARYRKHKSTSAQVPALVDLVLKRLSNQKELGEEDIDEPWLFLPNLRDDVLRSVHSLSEREGIWQKVKAVVEQNSNVRTSQREGRNGEVGRAWEWIGPIGSEGARRRRSGRVSWGPEVKSESPDTSREMREVKKWDEPRPIY